MFFQILKRLFEGYRTIRYTTRIPKQFFYCSHAWSVHHTITMLNKFVFISFNFPSSSLWVVPLHFLSLFLVLSVVKIASKILHPMDIAARKLIANIYARACAAKRSKRRNLRKQNYHPPRRLLQQYYRKMLLSPYIC